MHSGLSMLSTKTLTTQRLYIVFAVNLLVLLSMVPVQADPPDLPVLPISHTSIAAYYQSFTRISETLESEDLEFGSPLFIRIFKRENELELWLRDKGNYKLYKTYVICFNSGDLGPKQKEGDRQSPEGFYQVGNGQMNPWSDHHLAFNLGYPNDYDRYHMRTGSALMIHGRCSSDGCFAMTDYYMDEIYTIAHEALAQGQHTFDVHIFPFRFTPQNIITYRNSPWFSFWLNLKEGYDFFETHHLPPQVSLSDGRYFFTPPSQTDQLAHKSSDSKTTSQSAL